jgi:lysophospholipase L1-like esterase
MSISPWIIPSRRFLSGLLAALLSLVASAASLGGASACWAADRIVSDPLFFVQEAASAAPHAFLLRVPSEVPGISSASGAIHFQAGRDFVWPAGSREITLPAGSRIPFRTWAQLHPPPGSEHALEASTDQKSWLLYSKGTAPYFHDLEVAATYASAETAPIAEVPAAPAPALSQVRTKLSRHQPIKLVVLGDSISMGYNASELSDVAPRQAGYVGLVAEGLRRKFGATVTVVNLSVAGKSTNWGVGQAERAIAENPDLFICAFGMNDASERRPVSEYAENIRKIAAAVRTARPACDVVLVSPMSANPEWTKAAPELYGAYAECLSSLTGPGVALADVNRIWRFLLTRKRPLDLSGNGINHPNDFGHRVYADVVLATIGPAN